jgi:hypothetical protein
MKKLFLGFALVVGMIGNAQIFKISSEYFYSIGFDDISEIKQEQLLVDSITDNNIIPWNSELVFDLTQNSLAVYEFHFSDKQFEHVRNITITNVEKNNNSIKLTLNDSNFWNQCIIYTDSKKILFFNTETNIQPNFVYGICAVDYN